ncbi:MAG: DUF1553 domain-containing protein [Puniceicoccaceae bacterium]
MTPNSLNRRFRRRRWLISSALFIVCHSVCPAIVEPFETELIQTPAKRIDELIHKKLDDKGIQAANHCSDAVFLRRAFIDVTGTLPPAKASIAFQRMKADNKRSRVINQLLESDSYVDYWTLKWSDLLRIKAEFPINLWPNGVQAYHRWIKEAVSSDLPYDQFVRELLTSSGSNFRVPPVNFYRAIEGQKPETIAAAVALTFMGTRFESMTKKQRADMAHIFSRVAYKSTDEWKEEIVYLDPTQYSPMEITFPDGKSKKIAAGEDPRQAFADWLVQPDNPWFTKSIVNRVWFWLMGRGLIHEPDDIRGDNPCVNPALMSYLQKQFVKSGYDIKGLFRLILNSRAYQQSAIPQSDHPEAEALFAHYNVRRLDAEVLIDALGWFGGSGELYQSPVPEPFTFVPEYKRTITLSDGTITSQFLEKFGRPGRDSGTELERNNEISVDQTMYLLNSSEVQKKIRNSPLMKAAIRDSKGNNRVLIRSLYLILLSRNPTPEEMKSSFNYYTKMLPKTANNQRQKRNLWNKRQQASEDLAWSLINSKEFLHRH